MGRRWAAQRRPWATIVPSRRDAASRSNLALEFAGEVLGRFVAAVVLVVGALERTGQSFGKAFCALHHGRLAPDVGRAVCILMRRTLNLRWLAMRRIAERGIDRAQ